MDYTAWRWKHRRGVAALAEVDDAALLEDMAQGVQHYGFDSLGKEAGGRTSARCIQTNALPQKA
eukprot:1161229-Pelagomonas_calceolata.AAC.6